MSMEEAFAPALAKYKAEVIFATFGHLEPKPRRKYRGYIVFTWAGYGGNIDIITASFKGLNDSPGLCMDMQDFVSRYFERRDWTGRGTVRRFDGVYMRFKNGKCRFSGKVRRVKI